MCEDCIAKVECTCPNYKVPTSGEKGEEKFFFATAVSFSLLTFENSEYAYRGLTSSLEEIEGSDIVWLLV